MLRNLPLLVSRNILLNGKNCERGVEFRPPNVTGERKISWQNEHEKWGRRAKLFGVLLHFWGGSKIVYDE